MNVRPIAQHVLALAAPLGAFLALNVEALGAWWTHDDPCLIAVPLRSGIAPHFYDPQVWRELSGTVLMPWQTLSLGLDAHLFGLEPAAFYAHHLVAFAVLLGVAYAVFRGVLGTFGSSFALTLFALSTPAYGVARLLMNRHYLEGTIFVLGALGLYLAAVRRKGWWPAVAGAGLYVLAMAAKEVFVPFVAILVVLPVGTWRERLTRAMPYGVAAALYVPWRLYMLGVGNSLSGYLDPGVDPDPFAVLGVLGLPHAWQAATAVLVVAAALAVVARRTPGVLVLAGVCAVAFGGPLLTIPSMLAPRHFFLPALAVAVLLAAALGHVRRRGVAATVAVAVVAVVLLLGTLYTLTASRFWQRHGATAEHYRAEGTFFLDDATDAVLLTNLPDTNFLSCLDELRRDVLGRSGGPGYCGEPCWCARTYEGASWWRFTEGRVTPFERLPGPACKVDRPLTVTLDYDRRRSRLAWELGPYGAGEGTWALLLVRGRERPGVSIPVPLAASGEIPLTLREPLGVIVTYRAAEGWRTCSPVLTLDPEAGDVRWP